jgi:hypothetical protein
MIREAASAPVDAPFADFALLPLSATSPDCSAALAACSRAFTPAGTHPPALLDLDFLRTVILLV